ncbi:MAG: hypothetical protein BIFFINMI_00549 [Phycisphaerae bacterium]|nr:hypothetical protein [Phycisphaerae bacterium]
MKRLAVLLLALLIARSAAADTPAKFAAPPTATRDGKVVTIRFAVSGPTDVAVCVLDAKGQAVRHLAAGVLGAKADPPAPLKPGLSQDLSWDGNDDYCQAAGDGPFRVRVRLGMGVKPDRIVGGNPYAYFSPIMGQGDHSAWRITGLEAKPDGTVYVLGNANNYGPPALRAYSADGEYLRTVYPPPAGKPTDQMKGWGLNIREDGTYTPGYADVASPAITRTLIAGTRGAIANLIPSPGDSELWLESGLRVLRVNTDGTIPAQPMLEGSLINAPKATGFVGQMQIAVAPDRKSFYLAGVFTSPTKGRDRTGADSSGPWRDGQVYQVDYATRTAKVVFALDADTIITDLDKRGASPIADAKYGNYAALEGVAADADGRLFICDRQNKRILIQDAAGKPVRQIACEYPDAVGLAADSKTLFVTTRKGHYHGGGELTLLKFDDWSKDDAPSATVPLCHVQHYSQPTHMAVARSKAETFVWVAYSGLPVRVYRSSTKGLELVKDFEKANDQWALDMQHMQVDAKTGSVYFADGFGLCFRVADWANPRIERLMSAKDAPIRAIALTVDARNRWLYTRGDRQPVLRWELDSGPILAPAPVGESGRNICTPVLSNDWRIGLGRGDRGIAAAPDGSLATLSALGTGADYGGHPRFFHATATVPWEGLLFSKFDKIRAGGIRFDPQGNLYLAKFDGQPTALPKGFEHDSKFLRTTGRIYKIAPTGSLASGNLFPTEPESAAKAYDVPFGSISDFFSRTPRFGVDAYGRIYYPSSLVPCVGVIDNAGNRIVEFGQYANRDSTGGLVGDTIPTAGVPMGWPNSVDATDDYVYVSDIVNIRLMRLAKTFAAAETVEIK